MTKVFVYYNLRKKCYSIKALSGVNKGLVVGHAARAMLWDCEFRVSEAGRQRVLREKRKNVHAGIVGFLVGYKPVGRDLPPLKADYRDENRVTYNPYKHTGFVLKANPNIQVRRALGVFINELGVFAETKFYHVPEFDTTKGD